MGRTLIDVDGQRFGRLVASNKVKKIGRAMCRLCYCDCGKKTWQATNHLTSGHTKSCGCLLGEFKKLPHGRAARNVVLDGYKRGAKSRGFCWRLSDKSFDTLTSASCYYCGSPPNNMRNTRRMNGAFVHSGIDRKDNSKGYTKKNCVSCCKICNRAKSGMGFDDFMSWIRRLQA